MKRIKSVFALLFLLTAASAFADFNDTPAQLVKGIAVGANQSVEVSFATMSSSSNVGGCTYYNRSYVVAPALDGATKGKMLDLLMAAKLKGSLVRVRLSATGVQATDCTLGKPNIIYVFADATWL